MPISQHEHDGPTDAQDGKIIKMVRFWERSSDAPLRPSMSERMPRRWVSARTNITIRLFLIPAVTAAWAREKIIRASDGNVAERPGKSR